MLARDHSRGLDEVGLLFELSGVGSGEGEVERIVHLCLWFYFFRVEGRRSLVDG